MPRRPLVLASTSPYRRMLLERLRLPFETIAPGVNEGTVTGEPPIARAERLALAKAAAVRDRFPEALIIGSDQVATLGDTVLDKPGDHATATRQLRASSGRTLVFYTALALHDARSGEASARVIPVEVRFRTLTDAEIERYLALEQPYDCAGSAKVEALGISLIERSSGDDPTALIGLPLIALCQMLRRFGVAVP